MSVTELAKKFKERVTEVLHDAGDNVTNLTREIKEVAKGKTPEQIEHQHRSESGSGRHNEQPLNDSVHTRPVIESPAATALGGVRPEMISKIGGTAIAELVSSGSVSR